MHNLELTASVFREISRHLPVLKQKTSVIMNECHNSNYSEDFWWALVGRYSIYAYFLNLKYEDNPLFVENLFLQNFEEKNTVMELSRKASALNTPFCLDYEGEKDLDCSFDINEFIIEEDFFDTSASSTDDIVIPYKRIFFFFQKALNFYRRVRKPIDNFHSIKKPETIDFEYMFFCLVPIIYKCSDFLFFYKFINFLPKKKTVTFLGYELSQIELMYISCLYQNQSGGKNHQLRVLTHGISAKINPEFIWYKEVFKSKFKFLTNSLILPEIKEKKSIREFTKPKILIIAPDRMDGIFSPNEKLAKCYLNFYNSTLAHLANNYGDSIDISIRRKTLSHGSPIIRVSEVLIKTELEAFEEAYVNYDLFVIFDINTILGKCYVNKLNFISYYSFYMPTSLEVVSWAKTVNDIYFDELIFMKNLKTKIDKILY